MIWASNPDLSMINATGRNCMVGHLGIEFTEIGDDYLIAKMPVDHRTKQPMGLLHGGASAVLAETLGSVASILMIEDLTKQTAVGVEINANHLNSAKSGFVYGKVSPIKVGRNIHVWQIDIKDENDKAICRSRLTTAIISRKKS